MEPRVLFFRVGVFSESFFVSQPFAAPVDDFPAIGESRAFEQPQHGLVVEVGVDAEGFDAAFLRDYYLNTELTEGVSHEP